MATGQSAHQPCRNKRSQVRIVTRGSTGLSAGKRAIQHTIVAGRREDVRDDRREQEERARDKTGSAGDNFHTLSDGEESVSETGIWKVSTKRTCGTRPMTKLNMKQ